MLLRTLKKYLRSLIADRRGSSDLTVNLLLTAAGAAMVGITLPVLFKSSESASRTFDGQVKVLERGSSSANGASGGGQSPWELSFGPDGLKASGPVGGVSGSVSIGKNGVSGGVTSGAAGQSSTGAGAHTAGGGGASTAGGGSSEGTKARAVLGSAPDLLNGSAASKAQRHGDMISTN